MPRRGKDKFLTEYQVINQWRSSVVSSDFTMTYIVIPLSVTIIILSFSIMRTYPTSKWYFFGLSIILIVFWRVYAHYLDSKIFKTYTRILELEEMFEFHFMREYLASVFWKKKELKPFSPTWLEVRKKIEEFENQFCIKKWLYLLFHYRYSRGHLFFNCLALIVLLIEVFLIKDIIPKLCLRNSVRC